MKFSQSYLLALVAFCPLVYGAPVATTKAADAVPDTNFGPIYSVYSKKAEAEAAEKREKEVPSIVWGPTYTHYSKDAEAKAAEKQ